MTRIDFYLSAGENESTFLAFVCKLVAKAYRLGHHIFIFTEDEKIMQQLDSQLWSFQPHSFIPHSCHEYHEHTPVLIADKLPDNYDYDLCVNLSENIFADFSRFKRVVEVIDQQPQRIESGRKRFKMYRHKHYPIHQHDLRKKTQHATSPA